MMIWNSINFNFPSSCLMQSTYLMMDYAMLILISMLFFILINLSMFILDYNYFNLKLMENHKMEFVWTIIPFIILIFISVPSLICLYTLDSCFLCGLNISIIGHQWYWEYQSNFLNKSFNSYMMSDYSFLRLLEVDNNLIIPSKIPIRIFVTSEDVVHSWTVPSMGVKMDAIPGRINQMCLVLKKVGLFFGQCSEICGINHSFMPIVLESIVI